MTAVAALTALPASVLTIGLLVRSPLGRRVVAAPKADRWHRRDTPLLGGIGIFAGLLVGVGVAVASGSVHASGELLGIVGGCAILFVAGLVDDVFTLPPAAKLAAQGAAAAVALASGLRVEVVSNGILATVIGVLWLVGVTNAFNLLDNMDGLAATLAAIACAFFAIDAVTEHQSHVSLAIALSVCLACAGFLPFNLRLRRPAAVFMGDSGSQVLGFSIAALGLFSSWKVAGSTIATLILPILVLAVPILDTTLVTIVRLLEGRPISQGGRDHTSHRLVYQGLSEKRAVILLGLVSAGLGATSLGYEVLGDKYLTLAGVLLTFAFLLQFGSTLADVNRAPSEEVSTAGSLIRSLLVHRRRFAEALIDFALIIAAFAAAYAIRIQGEGSVGMRYVFNVSLPAVIAARYLAFMVFGLYRGVWRYAGARDAMSIVTAVVTSEVVAYLFLSATISWGDFPQGIFIIDALICSLLIGAARFWERAVARGFAALVGRGRQRRVVIVGAGRSGRSLLRELRETPGEHVIGFVDDDPALRRRRIQGTRVAGSIDEIGWVIGRFAPDAVLVTIPNAARDRLEAVLEVCGRAGIPCQFVRREIEVDPALVLDAAAK